MTSVQLNMNGVLVKQDEATCTEDVLLPIKLTIKLFLLLFLFFNLSLSDKFVLKCHFALFCSHVLRRRAFFCVCVFFMTPHFLVRDKIESCHEKFICLTFCQPLLILIWTCKLGSFAGRLGDLKHWSNQLRETISNAIYTCSLREEEKNTVILVSCE